MREFYRDRETQLTLEQVDLNRSVSQVVDLTRPRWSDQPQQRGLSIELRTDLAAGLPGIMGADNEIRDALTNLVFNGRGCHDRWRHADIAHRHAARRERPAFRLRRGE